MLRLFVCLFSLFFFFNDPAPTAIYTLFPTRRSSDLLGGRPFSLPAGTCDRPESSTTSAISPRSEEHTSELQSPDHLVCRLLLEKKKKKNIQTSTVDVDANLLQSQDSTQPLPSA